LSLTIDSTRFGRIEVAPQSAIEFPHGLIGLDSRSWTLIAREQDAAFVWLHSLEDPSLALPLTDPRRFFGEEPVELAPEELERIGVPELAQADLYVTVRASASVEACTANLRAPIVIAAGRGHQVINQASGAALRAPLFGGLASPAAGSAGSAGRAA
jgi:flagellar assembly factor FliW